MDKQKKQDIIIKVCCVVAALVLWMYIRISQDPVLTSTVKYVPVQILNESTLQERNLVLMKDQEFYINLSVKATSSVLAGLDKNKDFKLVADLQGYALTPGENKVQVTVKESPTGVSVVNPEGLLMKIDVDNYVEKEVPIEVNLTGKVDEGYYNNENKLSVTSATVSGPGRYVNKVTAAIAEIDLNKANTDLTKSYILKGVDEDKNQVSGITIYPETVEITSKINKGKYLPINVVTSGAITDSLSIESIEVIPKSIEVVGEAEAIDKIASINTEPINLSKITDNTTLEVNLVLPENIYLIGDVKTVKVNVSIKKFAEKTIKIPIEYTNLGEKLQLSNNPQEVELVFRGESSVIEGISEGKIKASVNLNGLSEGKHSLNVEVAGIPDNVELKTQNPKTVNVELKSTKEEISTNGNQS